MTTEDYGIKEITEDLLNAIPTDLADEFWKKTKEINWPEKDIDTVKETMSLDQKKLYCVIAKLYRHILEIRLRAYSEKEYGTPYAFPQGVSDDGFWDLTAHIVGLGKKSYESVLDDVTKVKDYLDSYKENFEYNFQY